MDKNRLSRFISKYNLAGLVESVSWKAENKTLTTRFISDDKTVLGSVSVVDFDFEDSALQWDFWLLKHLSCFQTIYLLDYFLT